MSEHISGVVTADHSMIGTTLARRGLSAGKRTRLHRILYRSGLGNGTALFLPYDQGFEHGPRDFTQNPASGDPAYVLRLAAEGGFNAVVLQIGLAEKFSDELAGAIPLVLKLNGKTDIPPDDEPLSPVHATVADAVRLGADAVGYTLYVGTPAQEADFAQYHRIRADATALGMPLIVWAYPRGAAIDAKGGRDSFYAVDYAARVASELGADVVKVNFPPPGQANRCALGLRQRRVGPGGDQRGRGVGKPHPAGGVRRRPRRRPGHVRQGTAIDGGGRHRVDLRSERVATRPRRVASFRLPAARDPQRLPAVLSRGLSAAGAAAGAGSPWQLAKKDPIRCRRRRRPRARSRRRHRRPAGSAT